MPLSGQQFADLSGAVCGSLDWAGLEQLVQFKLNVRLSDEVTQGPFKQVVFDWITWLEKRGRTDEFVGYLFAERKENELVRRYYEAAAGPQAAPRAGTLPPNVQKQELRKVLLAQFPRKSDLEILLSDSLNESLDAVAGGENQTEVCFNLVNWLWVDTKARLTTFLAAAMKERVNSVELRRFAEVFDAAPSVIGPTSGGANLPAPPPPASLSVPDDARQKVVEFRTLFRASEEQFGYLNALKDLHDTLHTLHDMQEGIEAAVALRKVKPGSGGLALIGDDLIALAVEAKEARAGMEFPEDAGWVDTFSIAAERLKSANPADVDSAVKTLRELPDQHQSELDADLVRTLKRMKPTELAVTAAGALEKLSKGGQAASLLLSEFRARLGGFTGLCAGLTGRMEQHTTCQKVEVILAPFAHAPDDLTAEKVPDWAKAVTSLARLAEVRAADPRARNTADNAAAFATAVPPDAAERFATLIARFRRLFQDVDKELLAATDDLVHEARLLGVQLRAFTNVSD